MQHYKDFDALAKRRWRMALLLTTLMIVIYFGFILLVAFQKPLLATLVGSGLTLGILLGVIVIISAWLLTFIYVRWANHSYDPEIARLRERFCP